MDLDYALWCTAQYIWENGEDKGYDRCLIPDMSAADELFVNMMGATHYRKRWLKKGKTVHLSFAQICDENGVPTFGAVCGDPVTVGDFVVEMKNDAI